MKYSRPGVPSRWRRMLSADPHVKKKYKHKAQSAFDNSPKQAVLGKDGNPSFMPCDLAEHLTAHCALRLALVVAGNAFLGDENLMRSARAL